MKLNDCIFEFKREKYKMLYNLCCRSHLKKKLIILNWSLFHVLWNILTPICIGLIKYPRIQIWRSFVVWYHKISAKLRPLIPHENRKSPTRRHMKKRDLVTLDVQLLQKLSYTFCSYQNNWNVMCYSTRSSQSEQYLTPDPLYVNIMTT